MLWNEPAGASTIPGKRDRPKRLPQNALRHSTESFVIPSVLETHHNADAIGDYCAKKNFMTKSYADRLGLVINRKSVLSVLTGSGKSVTTIGTATARFRFKLDPQVYALSFEILQDCIHDLILGKRFLKATKTFSSAVNRARRLVRGVINKVTGHHALFLGDSAPNFTGRLNGKTQTALADSGSKVLLMDEDYAQSLGLPIVRGDGHHLRLVFADNSTAVTSGMAVGVKWSFGITNWAKEYSLDFHLLKNAPAPVILSDQLLFEADAYSTFDCYLDDEDEEDDDAYFLAIDIDTNYQHEGQSSRSAKTNASCADHICGLDTKTTARAQHIELIRRGEEDDRIDALPIHQRQEARLVETQRRVEWDSTIGRFLHSPAPAVSSNLVHHASNTCPPRRWKSRWRLRLRSKKKP
jgi:hypothetical protein